MINSRVIEALAIGDEHAEHRAEFQELMPVAIVARQARRIETDHQAGVAKADFGDQFLKAVALDAAGAGFSQILVDDLNTLARPSQPNGAIDEAVLQLRALLMLTHLVHRRLPDVNVSQLGAMRRGETLISDIQCHQHE